MSMALAGWLVVKQWSWLADDMGGDGMSCVLRTESFRIRGTGYRVR